jgi:hypothetical protein
MARRPWLPVITAASFGHDNGHAMLLLINRNTGQAYFFEPNGEMDHRRKLYALIALPNTYRALVTYGGLKPSEWRTTTFVTGTVDGFGPQAMQGPKETLLGHNDGNCLAWSTLFYHLFILHPELSPDELLERMLAPKQRMHLGTIVARYSMYMTKNVLAKAARHNAKYAK